MYTYIHIYLHIYICTHRMLDLLMPQLVSPFQVYSLEIEDSSGTCCLVHWYNVTIVKDTES